MTPKALRGKLTQLAGARPALWAPFISGWFQREKNAEVPCLLPMSRRLLRLPMRDFYISYQFFSESRQGREELAFFLRHIRAGDIVYDIGGFRGAYGIAVKLASEAEVVIFEPVAENAEAIRNVCRLNALDSVAVVAQAVGHGRPIQSQFSSSSGMVRLGDRTETIPLEIPSLSLDDYVATQARPPQLLKIDVDGFERHVFEGATTLLREHRPRIWLELHPEFLRAQGSSDLEVLDLLRSYGYTLEYFADRDLPTAHLGYHLWCC